MNKSIEDRTKFNLIRYANCWEDADILVEALRPGPGKRFLSIASAGDNSLSLIAGGAEVVAVDLSAAQLACVELRRAAFRQLSYDDLLAFLGVTPAVDRLAVYRSLSHELTPAARAYWDANPLPIVAGLIHAGKFENYFRQFRTKILPLVHSQSRIDELLSKKELPQRRDFYTKRWNTFRWRLLFRCFFSRFVMGRLGRDPEFFRYVEGSVSSRILARTEHALTELPTDQNPYLNYILTGNFGNALPHYLRRENFEAIRDGLDRLTVFQGPIQAAAVELGQTGFDGYNLSDIFEYLDDGLCLEIYTQLLNQARPGARLAYWNMLVPRQVPPELADRVHVLADVSNRLFWRDQAWFYSKFVVEEVAISSPQFMS